MNRPCKITFYEDAAPFLSQLPERYARNAESDPATGVVYTLLVQSAFPIDFAPHLLRTRVGGTHDEDPIDFPWAGISHVEWFYGQDVPAPLTPWVPRTPRTDLPNATRSIR